MESRPFLIRPSLGPVLETRQAQVDVALGGEGESGGGVAELSAPARQAHAHVAVCSIVLQDGHTAVLVLTPVLQAADQSDVAVPTPPGLLTNLRFGAVAFVGVGCVFAGGSVPAGIAGTLVDVFFAMDTFRKKKTKLSTIVAQHKTG